MELGSTEQVLHCLVVHCLVGSCKYAYVYLLVLVNLMIECRGKREHQVVVVLSLDVVHSVAALCCCVLV